jgi:hypothetical protein
MTDKRRCYADEGPVMATRSAAGSSSVHQPKIFIIEGMAPALTETELDEVTRELAKRIGAAARPEDLQIVRVL